jgi:ATP-dependent DNA helicase RecG
VACIARAASLRASAWAHSAEEKDAIMDRFRRGETHALIATTVIEVGIDVPMPRSCSLRTRSVWPRAVASAPRAIGRGEHKSYCVLLTSKPDDSEAQEKLRILEQTSDGFAIAEAI